MELWHLVPKNDGYYYLCADREGMYHLAHKAHDPFNKRALIFASLEKAEWFLNYFNLTEDYKPEKFYQAEGFDNYELSFR